MATNPPILTPRLSLRSFQPEDSQDLYAYLSNPQVYIFEPGEPVDREKAVMMAKDLSASPDFWAVELTCEQKVIGQVYFSQVEPKHLMTWELGYILSPSYHRHGYGSEAAQALVQHAVRSGNTHRIVAHCNPENTASWKLLEKIGFRREGRMRRNVFFRKDANGLPLWTDTFIYALLAEEIK